MMFVFFDILFPGQSPMRSIVESATIAEAKFALKHLLKDYGGKDAELIERGACEINLPTGYKATLNGMSIHGIIVIKSTDQNTAVMER